MKKSLFERICAIPAQQTMALLSLAARHSEGQLSESEKQISRIAEGFIPHVDEAVEAIERLIPLR